MCFFFWYQQKNHLPYLVMVSLKRHRTSFEPSGRGQKRACSNHFPSNLVQDGQATEFRGSTDFLKPVPTVVLKRCIHKFVTVCNLSQATCCACIDARPEGFNFVRYIDGHAYSLTAHRWEYCCFGCQGIAQLCLYSTINADIGSPY
jgi:hypothetical protein